MKNNTAEAYRYLENANKLLKENCKVDKYGNYSDEKYVKMAGHTAWVGVLKALDPLHTKLARNKRKNVDTYRKIFENKSQNIGKVYNSAYKQLHLDMGYDGNTDTKIKKAAWKDAKILIDWADNNI